MMTILDSVQKDYPILNKAAGAFISKLSPSNLKLDIVLASEMAGLKLLRASGYDLTKLSPGGILLGAIHDEVYAPIQHFMIAWSVGNGIDPKDVTKVQIPEAVKNYLPEIANLEAAFNEVCQQNNVKVEYYPYVAVLCALKLTLAGQKHALLEGKTGLAMIMYHIIAGSKTVPYPPAPANPIQ